MKWSSSFLFVADALSIDEEKFDVVFVLQCKYRNVWVTTCVHSYRLTHSLICVCVYVHGMCM